MGNARQRGRKRGGGRGRRILWGMLAGIAILVALLVLLWNWNWFRPLIAYEASAALGRQVSMGRFNVQLGRQPALEFDDLAVADPPWFGGNKSLLTVRQLTLRIDPAALWHGKLDLISVKIDQPRLDLHTDASGKANWRFEPSTRDSGAASLKIEIGDLEIRDGTLHLHYPALKADFNADFRTQAAATGGEAQFIADAKGRYAGQPIEAHFTGGSVLSLRNPATPYPVDFSAVNGATRIELQGTLLQPMKLGGAHLELTLRGDSLAGLYALTAIPLPATPPYHLSGKLDYADHKVRFRKFSGVVGSSDLSGDIAIDPGKDRPLVTAHLVSKKVVLADLAGFIGATPGKAGAANTTPQLKHAQAVQAARPRVLPDTPINLPKLRSADLDIHYTGQRIEDSSTPLDDVTAHLTVVDGKLHLDPLSFGMGKGKIVAHIIVDASKKPLRTAADIDFRDIDLKRLLHGNTRIRGSGIIGGRFDLNTRGDSVAKMLGNSNGGLKLFMGRGNLNALLIDVGGPDFNKTVVSTLQLPAHSHLRCMIADLGVKHGVMKTRTLLLDTNKANIIGTGTVDFGNETLNYRLTAKLKHRDTGSKPTPIDIGGSFKHPSVKPAKVDLGTRISTTLEQVVLQPLAALIPSIQTGMAENHDCKALLKTIRKASRQSPAAVMKPLPKPAAAKK